MPKFALCVVCLTWLASVSVVGSEPSELEEQKQILAIVKMWKPVVWYERPHMPPTYHEVRQKLAGLKVSASNRSKLMQARTLIAVLGQHWDDFDLMAKEFDEHDPWFLKIKVWQLQAHVASKEWKSLADVVTELVDFMGDKSTYLADFSNPVNPMCLQLLKLRRAVSWPEGGDLPPDLQRVVDQVDRFEKSHVEIPKGVLKRLSDSFERDYEWIPMAIPQETALTAERWKSLIASQETMVAGLKAKSKSATRRFSDLQGRNTNVLEGMKAEKEHYAASRRAGIESRKLTLWRHFQATTDSKLSMAQRAGLWAWEFEQFIQTAGAWNALIFDLEQTILKVEQKANETK